MIRLMILSRYPKGFGGGIYSFIKVMGCRFSKKVECLYFLIGQGNNGQRQGLKGLLSIFGDIMPFLKMVKVQKCNCILVNTNLNVKSIARDGLYVVILSILGYRNIIVFFHGWYAKIEDKLLRGRVFSAIFKWIFMRPKAVIVLASRFKETLVTMGFESSRIHVLSTMFDGEIFKDIKRNECQDKKKILFLSRFIREKGIYELLEAFKMLSLERDELRLVMAGDGPELNRMKLWIQENKLLDKVEFIGFLTGIEKAQTLADADIFVLPTYYGEGCPVALLEAMAAGLPIITTMVD